MRKIITFLGTKPQATRYEFQGQIYTGQIFAEAMRQFVPHDEMLVVVTPEARANVLPLLDALNDPRIRAVPVPRGETNAEMWEIFQAITAQVQEGETVVFDITHGLRSLPFLTFLFAAYLKTAKRVQIEAIYYGALELRDDQTGKPAPVIDLSAFVQMLDWLTATDQFVQTGDARRLAAMLNTGGKEAARASQKLSQVSLAAFLCQPFTLMREAQTLDESLRRAEAELTQTAPPFGVLREKIAAAFTPFGADFENDVQASLCAQCRLIEWYFKNNQLIQAMTLAREWLISAVTWRLGLPIDKKTAARQQIEWGITGQMRLGRECVDETTGAKYIFGVEHLNAPGRRIYETWVEKDELVALWNSLAPARNALDHAEHQVDALRLNKIVAKAGNEVMPRLRALAARWGLA